MKKKIGYLIVIGTLSAMVLSGCSNGQAQTSTVTIPADSATIEVEGTEQISLTPDMASVNIGVVSDGTTIEEVTKKNSDAVDKIIDHLKSLEYADDSISTSNIGLYPQYDYSNNVSTLVGYRMNTSIVVEDIKIDGLSDVLNGSLGNGANSINSINYYSSGFDTAYEEALTKAIDSAREKANAIAESTGKKVKDVQSIVEHSPNTSARYSDTSNYLEYGDAAAGVSLKTSSMDIAVQPGTVDAEASVTVVFEMD